MNTHIHSLAVARVNNDSHLSQVARSRPAAERMDLTQQDSGHDVSGESQVSGTDGREGQRRHLTLLSLLQTVSDDGYQLLRDKGKSQDSLLGIFTNISGKKRLLYF